MASSIVTDLGIIRFDCDFLIFDDYDALCRVCYDNVDHYKKVEYDKIGLAMPESINYVSPDVAEIVNAAYDHDLVPLSAAFFREPKGDTIEFIFEDTDLINMRNIVDNVTDVIDRIDAANVSDATDATDATDVPDVYFAGIMHYVIGCLILNETNKIVITPDIMMAMAKILEESLEMPDSMGLYASVQNLTTCKDLSKNSHRSLTLIPDNSKKQEWQTVIDTLESIRRLKGCVTERTERFDLVLHIVNELMNGQEVTDGIVYEVERDSDKNAHKISGSFVDLFRVTLSDKAFRPNMKTELNSFPVSIDQSEIVMVKCERINGHLLPTIMPNSITDTIRRMMSVDVRNDFIKAANLFDAIMIYCLPLCDPMGRLRERKVQENDIIDMLGSDISDPENLIHSLRRIHEVSVYSNRYMPNDKTSTYNSYFSANPITKHLVDKYQLSSEHRMHHSLDSIQWLSSLSDTKKLDKSFELCAILVKWFDPKRIELLEYAICMLDPVLIFNMILAIDAETPSSASSNKQKDLVMNLLVYSLLRIVPYMETDISKATMMAEQRCAKYRKNNTNRSSGAYPLDCLKSRGEICSSRCQSSSMRRSDTLIMASSNFFVTSLMFRLFSIQLFGLYAQNSGVTLLTAIDRAEQMIKQDLVHLMNNYFMGNYAKTQDGADADADNVLGGVTESDDNDEECADDSSDTADYSKSQFQDVHKRIDMLCRIERLTSLEHMTLSGLLPYVDLVMTLRNIRSEFRIDDYTTRSYRLDVINDCIDDAIVELVKKEHDIYGSQSDSTATYSDDTAETMIQNSRSLREVLDHVEYRNCGLYYVHEDNLVDTTALYNLRGIMMSIDSSSNGDHKTGHVTRMSKEQIINLIDKNAILMKILGAELSKVILQTYDLDVVLKYMRTLDDDEAESLVETHMSTVLAMMYAETEYGNNQIYTSRDMSNLNGYITGLRSAFGKSIDDGKITLTHEAKEVLKKCRRKLSAENRPTRFKPQHNNLSD